MFTSCNHLVCFNNLSSAKIKTRPMGFVNKTKYHNAPNIWFDHYLARLERDNKKLEEVWELTTLPSPHFFAARTEMASRWPSFPIVILVGRLAWLLIILKNLKEKRFFFISSFLVGSWWTTSEVRWHSLLDLTTKSRIWKISNRDNFSTF